MKGEQKETGREASELALKEMENTTSETAAERAIVLKR